MTTIKSNEVQYILRKLLTIEADELVLNHPWLWEEERWKELVFAILTCVIKQPEDQTRELTDNMYDLGLLDISALANISKQSKTRVLSNSHARHILELFQETGLDQKEAKRGLTTICETALGLQKHYNSKIQHYLRRYGELMLREIDRTFQFSALKDEEVKYIFTYWLQNVLNMPLSLLDPSVVAFCERHHITQEELIAEADELDLNVSFLDDLILMYEARYASRAEGYIVSENSGSFRSKQGSSNRRSKKERT